MITYPVDRLNTRWSILQLSTGQIIARNKMWPVANGDPITGLDPDFVYLLQTRDTEPDYDSRLYSLSGVETPDAEANTLRTSWTPVKRPIEEQLQAVDDVEAQQFERHLPLERLSRETALVVALIAHFAIDGQTIPAKYRKRLTSYVAKVRDKLLPNTEIAAAKKAAIAAALEPDLDADWTTPNA